MHNKLFIVLITLIVLIPKLALSQNTASETDKLYKVENNVPGFSIAVFKGENIILEKQYGSANLDYNVPISSETVFDIGSIGKQFTAFAILLLEKQGKLSLNDYVYKYIDNLPKYKQGNPTIKQLLNQTSGIKEVDPIAGLADLTMQDMLSQSQMMNFITKVKELNFKPGEHFQYTNSNYILLADVIEKASKKPFDEFLHEAIFKPFGMENTKKKSSTYNIIKNRAIGYQKDNGNFYKKHLHSFVYSGDGQILTTAQDMFKWHLGLKKTKTKYPELYNKMHTKGILNNGTETNFGYGVEFETHNGHEAFGFDGMIKGGFVSKYLYFPVLDIGFFSTQNTFDWDFKDRFFQFVDLYVEKSTSKEVEILGYKEIQLSKKELKKYEGSYLFLGNEEESRKIANIKLKGNTLIVFNEEGKKISKLKPIGNHEFIFFDDKVLKFNLNTQIKQYTYSHYPRAIEAPWVFKEHEPYKHTLSELKALEGYYYNTDLQIIKKIKLVNDKLYLYYRNGAWRDEIQSLSKDVFEISDQTIKLIRNTKDEITGVSILGILFKKMN